MIIPYPPLLPHPTLGCQSLPLDHLDLEASLNAELTWSIVATVAAVATWFATASDSDMVPGTLKPYATEQRAENDLARALLEDFGHLSFMRGSMAWQGRSLSCGKTQVEHAQEKNNTVIRHMLNHYEHSSSDNERTIAVSCELSTYKWGTLKIAKTGFFPLAVQWFRRRHPKKKKLARTQPSCMQTLILHTSAHRHRYECVCVWVSASLCACACCFSYIRFCRCLSHGLEKTNRSVVGRLGQCCQKIVFTPQTQWR